MTDNEVRARLEHVIQTEYEAISDELAAAVPEQATLPLGRVEVAA